MPELKIKRSIKPAAKLLTEYGIQNEIMRYVGKGKQVIPRIIPFVNNKKIDINNSLKAQNINPLSYTGTDQFNIPEGYRMAAGDVLKIPLLTPRDSLFYMHSVRYWARLKVTNIKFPPTSGNYIYQNISYNKWNKQNYTSSDGIQSSLSLNGSVAVPSAKADPTAASISMHKATIYHGLSFILPLYEADSTVVHVTDDPIGYKQLFVKDPVSTVGPPFPEVITSFTMAELSGGSLINYKVDFDGEVPVFWVQNFASEQTETPYYSDLKVALIANSPMKTPIYGNLVDVPAVNDPLIRMNFPHIERLYAHTLQGINHGYNQIEREHLFPMDSTINIEIENIGIRQLLVNGYVYGYQILERGNKI